MELFTTLHEIWTCSRKSVHVDRIKESERTPSYLHFGINIGNGDSVVCALEEESTNIKVAARYLDVVVGVNSLNGRAQGNTSKIYRCKMVLQMKC